MIKFLVLVLLTSSAWAGVKPPPPQQQAQGQGQAQGQIQGQGQAQAATANNTIAEGAVLLNAGDSTNVLELNGGTTTVTTTNKRNAPAVSVFPSPTTAEMMVCFGLGGSGTEGAATGAWCRLQRELYSEHRATNLARFGEYAAAAEAYCKPKLHYADFRSDPRKGWKKRARAECVAKMAHSYSTYYVPPSDPVPPPQCDAIDERLNRCEQVNK